MRLLEQGTGSFKRAKHIKVRFFWLKDLIDDGEIVLIYVLSEELVADMLTKATTEAKFKYLREAAGPKGGRHLLGGECCTMLNEEECCVLRR